MTIGQIPVVAITHLKSCSSTTFIDDSDVPVNGYGE